MSPIFKMMASENAELPDHYQYPDIWRMLLFHNMHKYSIFSGSHFTNLWRIANNNMGLFQSSQKPWHPRFAQLLPACERGKHRQLPVVPRVSQIEMDNGQNMN